MTELQEGNFFKKHRQVVRWVLLIGGIILLLGWWIQARGINRTLMFVSANFTHILAHIFIYILLGSIILLIAHTCFLDP